MQWEDIAIDCVESRVEAGSRGHHCCSGGEARHDVGGTAAKAHHPGSVVRVFHHLNTKKRVMASSGSNMDKSDASSSPERIASRGGTRSGARETRITTSKGGRERKNSAGPGRTCQEIRQD